MKSKRKTRNFILKTLLPYKENPDKCGYENNSCVYLGKNGNKCAIGRHLKEGPWQEFDGDACMLFDAFSQKDILEEKAFNQNFTIEQWNLIQQYHDFIANKHSTYSINRIVENIEKELSIELPELYYGYL